MRFLKVLYIILGTLSLILGLVGIVVPGLPTTPFLLLTAWLYLKGSKKLHAKLMANKHLGKYIENFENNKGMSFRSKIIAISMMWLMIASSCTFFIETHYFRLIVIGLGLLGTSVIVFFLKTVNLKSDQKKEA